MSHRHMHQRHKASPFAMLMFGLLVFWLFGFKLFFLIPLFFIFGGFGMWGMCSVDHDNNWSDEKPKRKSKPKREVYIDDEADTTYL